MASISAPLEKFAIIGTGCRLPPNAGSLAAFWKFLLRGGNALKPIKADRWDWREYWDADPQRPGKTYQAKGAFLDADIRQFDPLAFGISPREAASLDPQQRLLLETAWEAFEDAGYPLGRISGSRTGVFVGGFCLDHLIFQTQPSNRHLINAHAAGGVMMTVLSNRLSHAFNLRGPSVTLDTACSSSLVALHYACQSLRLRECDLVLAGGVNVMSRPEFPIIMSKGHFLSEHGECHAFDESASGYARGEGAGVLLLKRYEEALADGDVIHAVVRATGVNQDGHTDGISLPNSAAQEELIGRVYRDAGIALSEVDYVEAHGTGTQAGDAAELGALHRSFSPGRDQKLVVGSVKSNIGHLEAAAGVAGLLKVIGVLKNRQIPKNLHFKKPNPRIPFQDYCVEVADVSKNLPTREEKPVVFAGINSFGYGGTNAHALLESAPEVAPVQAGQMSRCLVPVSARNEKALRDLAGKVAFQLGREPAAGLGDFAYSCAHRRNHLDFRAAAVAANVEELRDQLVAVSTGQLHEGVCVGTSPAEAGEGLVFVYTGMGPQWWGMGRELIRAEPVVAEALAEIDRFFLPLSGWSLRDAMLAEETESRMQHTDLAQPANFALQVALTRFWEAHGICPAAVVGHSVGEVSAAFVAGVYSLEEAVTISFHRSRLQQSLAGRGAMLATGLSEAEAEELLAGFPGVSVAAVNSFSAVTLSGDAGELGKMAAGLEQRGTFHKFLRVEVAYHSPQMDPLREELLESLAGLSPRSAQLPLYSTTLGSRSGGEEWDAGYWWKNVRQPVHFAAAIQGLLGAGYRDFLEIGPHPVLGNSLKECAVHLGIPVRSFTSLRRAEPEGPRLMRTLAELYCAGHDPDWRLVAPARGRFFPSPAYPWQRQLCWNESERSRMERLGLPGPVYLNRTLPGPVDGWEVEINRNYFPFLADHVVQDQVVFAGMAYLEAALCLGAKVYGAPGLVLENIRFERVLVIDLSKLQYLLSCLDSETGRFRILSREEGSENGLQRHCSGRIIPQHEPRLEYFDLAMLAEKCPPTAGEEVFYARLRRQDLNYGPAFRPVREIGVSREGFLAKIDVRFLIEEKEHPLHPVIFDAALQALIYSAGRDRLFVPFTMAEFVYDAPIETPECFAYGEFVRQSDAQLVAHVWLLDSTGRICARAREVSLQFVDTRGNETGDQPFYAWAWKPADSESAGRKGADDLLILADGDDSDGVLARELSVLLPEAALEIRPAGAPAGFDTAGAAALLKKHDTRSRLLVLWGSQPSENGEASRLSEKAMGLLQVAGQQPAEVIFVTRGAVSIAGENLVNPLAAPLAALGLLAQNEYEKLSCRAIDLPGLPSVDDARLLVEELTRSASGDVAYRGGVRWECSLEAMSGEKSVLEDLASPDEPVELRNRAGERGTLVGFERAERVSPGDGEVELRMVRAAPRSQEGGTLTEQASLEDLFWEGAGVVVRGGAGSRFAEGESVLAFLPGAFRTYATVPEHFVFRSACAEKLAGMLWPFLTAWHGLVNLARLSRGERLLVHYAAPDQGFAAITLAQWLGAEIFVLAEGEEKCGEVRELGVSQVFDSRTLDFGQHIKALTKHEGIDGVFGAWSGRVMFLGLGLLRAGGRYIHMESLAAGGDQDFPSGALRRNRAFFSLDPGRLLVDQPALMRRTAETVLEHLEGGVFPPSSARVIPAADLPKVFGSIRAASPGERIVADFASGLVPVRHLSQGDSLIRRDGCYLVTGGTSGFGLTTARWLAARGAGKVILVSRSGRKAAGMEAAVREMEDSGAVVAVVAADVTKEEQVRALSSEIGDFVLSGIIHAAMVLDDAPMAEMDEARFRRVFEPKVAGAFHLAELAASRPGCDFLVFYSSVSALVGNIGQANYIAANSLLDALAAHLRAKGSPATSINWGALAESGVVARDERLGNILASSGVSGLSDRQALEALERVIRLGCPNAGVFAIDWNRWSEANPKLAVLGRFRDLCRRARAAGAEDPASRLRDSLAHLEGEQRLEVVREHLREIVAATLRMPPEAISETKKLNELGVDSLLVLELSLGIRERMGIGFSAMEFLRGPSLRELAGMTAAKLWPHGD
jgi:acyl transferase domain-containing protein/NADPH:quinone reductase-like Zn-dependent oxidoreductase/acyl carrier protein